MDFPDVGTINVSATAQAPGIFARIFDINEVTVRAEAQARVFAPLELKDVAPIAVHRTWRVHRHRSDCFGQTEDGDFTRATRVRADERASSASSDLDRDGWAGRRRHEGWIENGYPDPSRSNK